MTSLLFALWLQQPALKDIHILGTPLEKAVARLGDIYGSPMDVSNLIKNQVVLIDAVQVSEKEVRDQIAKTLNATWEKKENGWHLTKTNQQQRQDEQNETEFKLRFLRKTIQMRAEAEGTKTSYSATFAKQTFNQLRNEAKNEAERQMPGPTAAGYGLPNQRLMSKFLLKFGIDRIAAIPNNQRVVFALRPNAMQKALNVDLKDELAAFAAEQSTYMKTMHEISKDEESRAKETHSATQEGVAVARMAGESGEETYRNSLSSVPAEVANLYFCVYCSDDGTYNMKLLATPVDSRQEHFMVMASTFEGAFAGMTGDDMELKPHPEFKLSERAKDFQDHFFRGGGKIPAERLKSRLDQFANTVENDPLSYGLSEAIVFDSRRLKKNIFACLADQNINVFEPFFGDTWFDPKFKGINEGVVINDGNWICMRKFPFSEPNIPRNELKGIIARVRTNGRVEIFDRAALAALRPRTNAYSYIEGMLERFANSPRDENAEDDALKCLGLMSPAEREAAMRPAGIPYSRLSSKVQRHLFECAYYNSYNRLWLSGNQSPTPPTYVVNEPTLLAPNGILPESVFTIESKTNDQIKDSDTANSYGLMTDARGWGGSKYQLDHPEDYPGSNWKFDINRKLSRMRVTVYTMKLKVNPLCEWSSQMQTVAMVEKEAFTLNNLPPDLKAEFDEGYKTTAEMMKKYKEDRAKRGGGGGGLR